MFKINYITERIFLRETKYYLNISRFCRPKDKLYNYHYTNNYIHMHIIAIYSKFKKMYHLLIKLNCIYKNL